MAEPATTAGGEAPPRASGVFAPISALPSSHGIGDLGPAARAFVDVLAEAGQGVWQVLPLAEPGNPANSPYDNHSGFALNRWLLSPDDLAADGLLSPARVVATRPLGVAAAGDRIDFGAMQRWKGPLLDEAADRLLDEAAADRQLAERLAAFEHDNAHWLVDYVHFMHLKQLHAAATEPTWSRATWPLRDRSAATAELPSQPTRSMRRTVAVQFLADEQWRRLRAYAGSRDVRIMSDLPFYEGDDGVTAWARPELFEFDEELRATLVGGAPPEPAFPGGQAWGMPGYRTDQQSALLEHFATRIAHEARRVGAGGIVRLDHVLGAAQPYYVDVVDGTCSGFRRLFAGAQWRSLLDRFPGVTFVVEDLGELTAMRAAFLEELDAPRMRVGVQALLEAPTDLCTSAHFADNVLPRDVMFTGGTHDYPFLRTWLHDHWDSPAVRQLRQLLVERGHVAAPDASHGEVARGALRLNAESPARTSISLVFDLLGMGGGSELPEHARAFNLPGSTSSANWATRIPADVLDPGPARDAFIDAMLDVSCSATAA